MSELVRLIATSRDVTFVYKQRFGQFRDSNLCYFLTEGHTAERCSLLSASAQGRQRPPFVRLPIHLHLSALIYQYVGFCH